MNDHDGRLRFEQDGHVLELVIDRPRKLNTITSAMDAEMNTAAYRINNDDSVRVVVIRGEGERAFCAGSDINGLDDYGDNWTMRNRFDARKDYARAVWQIRKPIVSAVDGHCIGGGLEIATGSDIRIGTARSTYASGEIRLGWHAGSGQTQLLTRLIGAGPASRMLMTGLPIDGEEAFRLGLIQELVEPALLRERAMEIAATIAELSPIAIQKTKAMIRLADNVPMEAALLIENDSFSYLMLTDDAAEGRAAFAEKRPAKFTGR